MIKTYLQFLNENLNSGYVHMSDKLTKILTNMNNPFGNLLLNLRNDNSGFRNIYADYMDAEKDGTISFVYNDKATGDPYKQSNRMSLKPTKILGKILVNPQEYMTSKGVTQRDIELFANGWKSSLVTDITVEEWSGDKILDAFNYNDTIDKNKFSFSCANFNVPGNGYEEPKKEW